MRRYIPAITPEGSREALRLGRGKLLPTAADASRLRND
jgi:hypothetical protein